MTGDQLLIAALILIGILVVTLLVKFGSLLRQKLAQRRQARQQLIEIRARAFRLLIENQIGQSLERTLVWFSRVDPAIHLELRYFLGSGELSWRTGAALDLHLDEPNNQGRVMHHRHELISTDFGPNTYYDGHEGYNEDVAVFAARWIAIIREAPKLTREVALRLVERYGPSLSPTFPLLG